MSSASIAEMARLVGKEIGDLSGFTDSDKRLIGQDDGRTWREAERLLSANPMGYKWHIVVDAGGWRPRAGEPGVITFVKFSNAADREPMTPHMLLHTAAHAVAAGNPGMAKSCIEALRRLACALSDSSVWSTESLPWVVQVMRTKSALHTIRGHDRMAIPDVNEAVLELLAVFIKNGKVTLSPNELASTEVRQRASESPEALARCKSTLESEFTRALDRCVGEVIYDD